MNRKKDVSSSFRDTWCGGQELQDVVGAPRSGVHRRVAVMETESPSPWDSDREAWGTPRPRRGVRVGGGHVGPWAAPCSDVTCNTTGPLACPPLTETLCPTAVGASGRPLSGSPGCYLQLQMSWGTRQVSHAGRGHPPAPGWRESPSRPLPVDSSHHLFLPFPSEATRRADTAPWEPPRPHPVWPAPTQGDMRPTETSAGVLLHFGVTQGGARVRGQKCPKGHTSPREACVHGTCPWYVHKSHRLPVTETDAEAK